MSASSKPHPTGFRCKECKVPVLSKTDFRPILGRRHQAWCKRATRYNR